MRLLASLAILVIAFNSIGAAQSVADQCRSLEKSQRGAVDSTSAILTTATVTRLWRVSSRASLPVSTTVSP
jgi:hypothetical protein